MPCTKTHSSDDTGQNLRDARQALAVVSLHLRIRQLSMSLIRIAYAAVKEPHGRVSPRVRLRRCAAANHVTAAREPWVWPLRHSVGPHPHRYRDPAITPALPATPRMAGARKTPACCRWRSARTAAHRRRRHDTFS